jgi:hypothetical protein
MLSGLQAATSRHTVSATMAHLIVSLKGTRFQYSHGFGSLLVSQLEATLLGKETDVYMKRTTVNKATHIWQDSSSEDYIHRPKSLESTCAFEMAMHYTKTIKPMKIIKQVFKRQNNDEDDNKPEQMNPQVIMASGMQPSNPSNRDAT